MRAIRRTQQETEAKHFSTHDLRRTVATRMGEMGLQPHIISKVLSHTDTSVTATHYNKWSYDQEKQKALDRWTHRLLEITEGKTPGAVIAFPASRRP
jgi:integrase